MSSPPRPSPAPAPPCPPRGEGQWALGHREPLNASERMKKDSDGLDVRQRIIDVYAHTGFDGIDPTDLRGRFRWMGLYTQRAQGIPGGKTAVLAAEELEDSFFMMRVRTDGGALTSEQLRVIGGISTEFGRDVADVTAAHTSGTWPGRTKAPSRLAIIGLVDSPPPTHRS